MKTAVLTLALTLVVGRIPALAENLPWETRLPFKGGNRHLCPAGHGRG